MNDLVTQLSQHRGDLMLVTSGGGAAIAIAQQVVVYVQIGAGLVAIASGLFACRWYWQKMKQDKKDKAGRAKRSNHQPEERK